MIFQNGYQNIQNGYHVLIESSLRGQWGVAQALNMLRKAGKGVWKTVCTSEDVLCSSIARIGWLWHIVTSDILLLYIMILYWMRWWLLVTVRGWVFGLVFYGINWSLSWRFEEMPWKRAFRVCGNGNGNLTGARPQHLCEEPVHGAWGAKFLGCHCGFSDFSAWHLWKGYKMLGTCWTCTNFLQVSSNSAVVEESPRHEAEFAQRSHKANQLNSLIGWERLKRFVAPSVFRIFHDLLLLKWLESTVLRGS